MKRFATYLLVLAGFSATPAGSAGPTLSVEQQYKAAVKREAAGDIAGALEGFEAIAPSKRSIAARVHIANCKAKLNRLLEAERELEATKADTLADQGWVETIDSDLQALRERVPKLSIRSSSGASEFAVTVDGTAVTPPVEYRVDPGTHVVRATRGDAMVFERTLTVDPMTTTVVIVSDGASTMPKPVPPPQTHVSLPDSSPTTHFYERPLPYFVAGGVFVGATVILKIAAVRASSSAEQNCLAQHSFTCDADAAGAGNVRTFDALALSSAGAAVLALGVGTYFAVGTHSAPKHALKPVLGRSFAGIFVAGEF